MSKIKIKSLLIITLLSVLITGCSQGETSSSTPEPTQSSTEQSVSIEPFTGVSFGMDTFIEQKWQGVNGEKTYNEIIELINTQEDILSLYKGGSDIASINLSAGVEAVEISKDTYDMLYKATQLSAEYNDYFDITIAPVTQLWGITGDSPKLPSDEEITNKLTYVGIEGLELSQEEGIYTAYLNREGMSIDLGGIAKGYTAQKAMEIAVANGSEGYLSIGGNLGVVGKKEDGTEFKFGVRDPNGSQEEYALIITLDGYTMSTTGAYERYFEDEGVRYHHVFDPNTGYPSDLEMQSVTVVSQDGALADCLSTALFVAGKDYALSQLERQDIALIIIDNDNNIYISPWYAQYVTQNPNVTGYNIVT